MLIPYKCRCEALGENKRRGGLYKSIKNKKFTVNKAWKNGRIFLCDKDKITEITNKINFDGENYIENDGAYIIKKPMLGVYDANAIFNANNIIITLTYGEAGAPKALGAELYDENLSLINKQLVTDGVTEIKFEAIDTGKNYTILLVTDDECLKLNVPEKAQTNFNKSAVTNTNKISENKFDFKAIGKNPKLFEIINNSQEIPKTINFEVLNQQEITCKGSANLPEIEPGTSKVIKLDFEFPNLSFFEYFIKLSIGDSYKIIKLPNTQSEPESYYTSEMNDLVFNETKTDFIFNGTKGDDFEIKLPKRSENASILENNSKYVTIMESVNGAAYFYAIYGDGEFGISAIGAENYEIDLDKKYTRVYYFGETIAPGIYDEEIKDKQIKNLRFIAFYAEDMTALLVKCMTDVDGKIINNKFVITGGESFSVTLRQINMDEEDIVREARTLPAIEQNG